MVPNTEHSAASEGKIASHAARALPHPRSCFSLSGIVTYLPFVILCSSQVLLTSEEKWKRKRKIMIKEQFKGQLNEKME